MQLPGMATDPVRLSLDLTWNPADGTFDMSRRLWTRPSHSESWELEDMATSGTPVPFAQVGDRWAAASQLALRYFMELVDQQDPF